MKVIELSDEDARLLASNIRATQRAEALMVKQLGPIAALITIKDPVILEFARRYQSLGHTPRYAVDHLSKLADMLEDGLS